MVTDERSHVSPRDLLSLVAWVNSRLTVAQVSARLYSVSPASSACNVGPGALRRRLMRPEELTSDFRVASNWVNKINNPVTASKIAKISPMIWSRSFTAYLPDKAASCAEPPSA